MRFEYLYCWIVDHSNHVSFIYTYTLPAIDIPAPPPHHRHHHPPPLLVALVLHLRALQNQPVLLRQKKIRECRQ